MTATVCVIMAVRNGERFLQETLRSVFAQTFADFEFLVVDDCSTDRSSEILAAAAAHDTRLRIVRNDHNLGLTRSLNRGLAEASARYIARIDADDSWQPQRLAKQVAFLDTHPDHLLVGSGYRSINDAGAVRYVKRNPMSHRAVEWAVRFRMPIVHPSFLFRANLPDGTPVRYDEEFRFSQDYELLSRLVGHGKVASLADCLVDYRMHAGNISMARSAEQRELARIVTHRNLEAVYPQDICNGLASFVEVQYGFAQPSYRSLAQAWKAMQKAIARDSLGERAARRWMTRRAAGYLAEAFVTVQPGRKALNAARFILAAPGLLLPLALRLAEARGVIAEAHGP